MKLTLSYALFLVIAGGLALGVIYVAMRYVPNYPLIAANPRDTTPVPARAEILESLVTVSGYVLALMAVIGLGGGWLIAGRVLQPLQDITRAAHRAAGGSLDHRVGLHGPRDEFTDLSDAFDHMLDRLQRSFESQRRFAANASHELHTPLTVTRTMLDVAIADPAGQDYPRLVSRLHDTNQRGIEIVDALLQLSALGHAPPPTRPVDLARTAAEAAATVRAEAGSRGVALSEEHRPVLVTGNDVLLHQLAVNLLQNALRHNLPAGGRATLSTGPDPRDPGRALLTVSNSGPPLTGAVDALTEPFLRGRGRTAEAGPGRRGHGLGLAIVASITDVHGGDLRLDPNPGGGLTVRVSLPAHH
ncbi:sensor histidine kinase [Actinomadura craniellae]|uniref:histidine kinase n=2 Tax=Actinomadura craniellae TaxID=2231787 RepID=A0A365H0F6_9ACTN|nr:sensor histidine kinase [Actinomadura craniellae]